MTPVQDDIAKVSKVSVVAIKKTQKPRRDQTHPVIPESMEAKVPLGPFYTIDEDGCFPAMDIFLRNIMKFGALQLEAQANPHRLDVRLLHAPVPAL